MNDSTRGEVVGGDLARLCTGCPAGGYGPAPGAGPESR